MSRFFLSTMLFLCLAFFCGNAVLAADENNNPIDKAFAKNFKDDCISTYHERYIYSEYQQAWKDEFGHAVEWRKKHLKFKEDRELFEQYASVCEKLASLSGTIELNNWCDINVSPKERYSSMGTGGLGAESLASAAVYKKMTLNIIADNDAFPEYKYHYSGKGVDIKKLEQ